MQCVCVCVWLLSHSYPPVQVVGTVVHSDYLFASSSIQRAALIEFVLLPTTQNCSFPSSCDFESTCTSWQLDSRSRITDSSPDPFLPPPSDAGHYLYSAYRQSSRATLQIASTIINESFCAVSFLYGCPASLELQVVVDGLDSVWSSVLVSDFSPGGGGRGRLESLVRETAEIDLQAVGILVNRTLTFEISLAEGQNPLASTGYAALDNITLHPCIDCTAPGKKHLPPPHSHKNNMASPLTHTHTHTHIHTHSECSFTSCIPGYYYSLSDESCVDCPRGY